MKTVILASVLILFSFIEGMCEDTANANATALAAELQILATAKNIPPRTLAQMKQGICYRTMQRIVDSTPQGLSVIPTGATVELIDMNGFRFIKYGRIILGVDKIPEGGLELFDPNNTTPDAPVLPPPTVGGVSQAELDEAKTGVAPVITVNPIAIAAMGDGLSKEERELLLKGRPDPTAPNPQIRALELERMTADAGFRLKYQQLSRELSDIGASLTKGRIVTNGKTRKAEIETEQARITLDRQKASFARNTKASELRHEVSAQAVAYERALAKYNLLISTK